MALRVFGLTGGIGSGKSAVAGRLIERGLPVIDADRLARLAVAKGSAGLRQIVEHFGAGALNDAGELDRARMAKQVFADDEARRLLDRIVHPLVRQLAAEQLRLIAEQGEPLACYEVPLLYEVGLEATLSPVLVVHAPPALQRARLAARDGLSDTEIEARIAAQMPLAEKVRRADYAIENDGSLPQLCERTDAAFEALCAAIDVPAARYPRPARLS